MMPEDHTTRGAHVPVEGSLDELDGRTLHLMAVEAERAGERERGRFLRQLSTTRPYRIGPHEDVGG